MLKETIRRLQFDKIIESISEFMPSYGAKEILYNIPFAKNIFELQKRHEILDESIKISLNYSPLPLHRITNIQDSLKRANIGSVLSCEELYEISVCLSTFSKLKKHFVGIENYSKSYPNLNLLYNDIFPLRNLFEEIEKVIDDNLEVKDTASNKLRNISREIIKKEAEIKKLLDRYISDKNTSIYLQENIITMRRERYVIPVKSHNKNKIKGAVLGQSSTGSTLYIEPLPVMEKNNEISKLYEDKKAEIYRILSELTFMVKENFEYLTLSYNACNEIFYYYGLSRFALRTNSSIAKIGEEINLIKARHLLIDEKEVVAIDIRFGKEDNVLIITGPNTGGKTVCLKLVGLLSLMHQKGFAIPASHGSTLPFFDNIYADIGDEQSIEQSLSTFSSHMVNIVNILKSATNKSLVLLDEVGAGTDPDEGAALAKSILESFRKKDSLVLASSHYASIKQFAMRQKGYMNASVSFDLASLKPTYNLLLGVAGSSNAISIAKRLGMPDDILENAIKGLDKRAVDLEDLLRKAQIKSDEKDEILKKAEIMFEDAKREKEKFKEKNQRLEEKSIELINKAKIEANKIIKDSKDKSKEIMKTLRNMKSGMVDHKKMESLYRDLTSLEKDITFNKAEKNKNMVQIKEGQSFYLPKLNTNGVALSKPNKKGIFKAQLGLIRMDVSAFEIKLIEEEKIKVFSSKKSEVNLKFTSNKLDIRGLNTLEAKSEIEVFIDRCLLSNIKKAEIVHGKGTGILGKYVQDFAKRNKNISSFRYGGYYEGGTGVTIIEFD